MTRDQPRNLAADPSLDLGDVVAVLHSSSGRG